MKSRAPSEAGLLYAYGSLECLWSHNFAKQPLSWSHLEGTPNFSMKRLNPMTATDAGKMLQMPKVSAM